MPKQEFFNLDDKKRISLIKAITNEMCKFGYKNFRVSKVIKETNISRSSFYLYFENKDDLFEYVITDLTEKKLEILKYSLNTASNKLSEMYRTYLFSFVELSKTHPLITDVDQLVEKSNNETLYAINRKYKDSAYEYVYNLFVKFQEEGILHKDIDIKNTIKALTTINQSIVLNDIVFNGEDCIDAYIKLLERGVTNT